MDSVETPAVEPEPNAPAANEPPASPPEGETAKDPRVEKANAEAAKYRKELREAQAALKAREDADKTEAQKAEERLKAAEEQVPTLLKRAIAAEHGLPPELAGRLVGSTEEELVADAESLKALVAPPAAGDDGQPSGRWPDAPQGPRGNPKPQSLPERIAALEAEGKYAEAGALKAEQAMQAAG